MEENEIFHPLYGEKKVFSPYKFPTKLEVLNYVRFVMESSSKKYQSHAEKVEKYTQVAEKVVEIWSEAYVTVNISEVFSLSIQPN